MMPPDSFPEPKPTNSCRISTEMQGGLCGTLSFWRWFASSWPRACLLTAQPANPLERRKARKTHGAVFSPVLCRWRICTGIFSCIRPTWTRRLQNAKSKDRTGSGSGTLSRNSWHSRTLSSPPSVHRQSGCPRRSGPLTLRQGPSKQPTGVPGKFCTSGNKTNWYGRSMGWARRRSTHLSKS